MADDDGRGDSGPAAGVAAPMTEAQGDQLLTELAMIKNLLMILCAMARLIAGKVIFWAR